MFSVDAFTELFSQTNETISDLPFLDCRFYHQNVILDLQIHAITIIWNDKYKRVSVLY